MKGVFMDQFRLAADAAKGPTIADALWATYCPEPVVAKPKEKPVPEKAAAENMDIATERLRKLDKPARTQEQEFAEINRLITKVERNALVESTIARVLKGK